MIDTTGHVHLAYVSSSRGDGYTELRVTDTNGTAIAIIELDNATFRDFIAGGTVRVNIACGDLARVGKTMTHRKVEYGMKDGDHKYHDGAIPEWLRASVAAGALEGETPDTPRRDNAGHWVVIYRTYE